MMNWKAALSFILSFSLAMPAAFAKDDTLSLESAKKDMQKAFLLDLNNRVVAIMDINRVHVEFVHDCLAKFSDSQFAEAIVPKDRKNFNPQKNCMHAVARVRQNTRENYPRMRQRLLLSNLLQNNIVNSLLVDYWTALSTKQQVARRRVLNNISAFSRDISVTNPLVSVLGDKADKELPVASWTPSEIRLALDIPHEAGDKSGYDFNQLMKKACLKHIKDPIRTRGSYDTDLCENLRLESNDSGEVYMTYAAPVTDARKLMREVDTLRVHQESALTKSQEVVKNEFLAEVQLNPYVALVTSSTPTRKELVRAFEVIKERAIAAVEEHDKFRKENNLDDPEKADANALLSLMRFDGVAATLLEPVAGKNSEHQGPGPYLEDVLKTIPFSPITVESTMNELAWKNNVENMKDLAIKLTAGVVGNMLICYSALKVGQWLYRGASVAVKAGKISQIFSKPEVFFNPMCYFVGGLALNIWLIWDDIKEYNHIYRDVFATVEEEHMIRKVNALSAQERTVFWSAVTIPVGSGLLKAFAPFGSGLYQYGKEGMVKLAPQLVKKIEDVGVRVAASGAAATAVPALVNEH